MSEKAIEDLACDRAVAAGWICRKMKFTGRRNAMDRFFLKDGRIVLVEFKRPGKDVEGGQAAEVELFKAAGAEVYVIDNPLTILRILGVAYETA